MALRAHPNQDNGSWIHNLWKDLQDIAKAVGLGAVGQDDFVTAAYATGNTTALTARLTYLTAGATVDAHTFNLPAGASDGQTMTLMTSRITTAATFGVASGTATIVGAPTATAVHTPITFKYIGSEDKWYRIA